MTFRQFQLDTPEYEAALQLRADILRKPLGLALTEAELRKEPDCFHLGGFDGLRLIAVLLLQPLDPRTFKMRQVAVDQGLQRTGVGSQLIAFAEDFARQQGCATIVAHARGTAVDFYVRLGYTASGDEFMEIAIPHRLVTKTLRIPAP